jgi:hypothetical protein
MGARKASALAQTMYPPAIRGKRSNDESPRVVARSPSVDGVDLEDPARGVGDELGGKLDRDH